MSKRLVWTTDPHLNHVPMSTWEAWIDEIASHGAEGIVISGDISEGDDVVFQLRRCAERFDAPIYFVLGNHDFYQNSIAATRRAVVALTREFDQLVYLTDTSSIHLTDDTYLVGEDGWGDGIEGDYEGSQVRLNDFPMIEDFRTKDSGHWKELLRQLGADSAARLKAKLHDMPSDAAHVLVVTHVPPFREACWYEGRTTDDNWAPFFVCSQVGSVLKEISDVRRDCRFTVLCGHTHNDGVVQMTKNLVVHTGAAVYGRPCVEGLVMIKNNTVEIT